MLNVYAILFRMHTEIGNWEIKNDWCCVAIKCIHDWKSLWKDSCFMLPSKWNWFYLAFTKAGFSECDPGIGMIFNAPCIYLQSLLSVYHSQCIMQLCSMLGIMLRYIPLSAQDSQDFSWRGSDCYMSRLSSWFYAYYVCNKRSQHELMTMASLMQV